MTVRTCDICAAEFAPAHHAARRCSPACRAEGDRRRKRRSHHRRHYGLEAEHVAALRHAVGDACAICGARGTADAPLCVDHDHLTGEVRGLLCAPCNLAEGSVAHLSASELQALADYRRGSFVEVVGGAVIVGMT